MSTDRDTTRIVRSWLQTDEYESADRVLDVVLDQLDTTPQRRATWWPVRRLPPMNTTAKLALAAAAVVVVALLGLRFMLPDVGGPTGTPEPTPIPSSLALPAQGSLSPGTYILSDPGVTARPVTITVPAGWSTDESFVRKGNAVNPTQSAVYLGTWIVSHVDVDACDEAAGVTETTTAQAIVDALSAQAGSGMTGPTADTLGGVATQRFDLHFDPAICNNNMAHLWPDAAPQTGGGQPLWPGQTMTIHVIDFDGDPMIVTATSRSGASRGDLDELEAVLGSVQFGPAEGGQ
jgi:hypothetical protein